MRPAGVLQSETPRLILASASEGRAALLRNAGLAFAQHAASIDEGHVKRHAQAYGESAETAAFSLARLKAEAISRSHPDAIVIGADQILECENEWFDKPGTLEEAAQHLRRLSNRTHRLVTACLCMRGEEVLWQHVASPRLTMRALTEDWIAAYLARAGESVLGSVGAYRIEGLGLQCFLDVEGEHAAIIGLPMLALLGFLRQVGLLGC